MDDSLGFVQRSIRPRFGLAFTLALSVLPACGTSSTEVAAPEAAEPARPKDAAQIAQNAIGGRVSALVHVDRVRRHPSASKFLEIGPIRELLAGSSFDPLRDVERVFVTGPSAADQRALVFAEHNVEPERIPLIVKEMVEKSEPRGEVLSAGPEWRVHVSKEGRGGVVAFLPSQSRDARGYVVIVPEDLVAAIDAFENTGGLPGPTGEEAAKFFAEEPSATLRARGAPRIPPGVKTLAGDIFVRPDGGVIVDAVGQSSAESAPQDAEDLTKSIDDATSVGIGIIRIRAFKPVVFKPSGDRIVTHHVLSPSEVDTILSVAASFVR
ncbi:MAG: hypothetical protein HOW73_29205 [Polyangiaceae bacterium]|nr:hypothetical protein [Polyangiaceae bacterium]